MSVFRLRKKKDCFEIYVFGKKVVFYRYLRMIREIFLCNNYILLRDTLLRKFNVYLPREAYYHLSGPIELVKVKLKDIRMPCGYHKSMPITETPPYKFLASKNKEKVETGYGEGRIFVPDAEGAANRMLQLEKDIRHGAGYDPSKCIIVLQKNNLLIDGQHRCAALYYVYGGDYEVLCAREGK